MPLIKSAKKRVKVAAKATARNAHTKRTLRDALKAFSRALDGGKPADITKTEREAMSAIDLAAKKAVIHKNKAARRKKQLAAMAKAKGVKSVKKAAKPTSAKKTSSKTKSSSKKTAKKTTSSK